MILSHAFSTRCISMTLRRQRGQVLLLLLLVLVTGAAYLLIESLSAASLATDRARLTQQALAEAKVALIAYAVNDANRPGSLPCPDANDDGWAKVPEDYSGSNCRALIGRLPWKTLGIGDLRDGYGERLWYALSNDFRASSSATLNSDTKGALTVVGTAPKNEVIAVLLSPGPVLVRQGTTVPQARGGPEPCLAPYSSTPKCDPVNYLDAALGEDNADGNATFVTALPTTSYNDFLLALTHEALFIGVNKRIAAAMRGSADPPSGIQGYYAQQVPKRYPWASNGSGHQVPGEKTGQLPYEDLPFDPDIKNVLRDNGWFEPGITVYTVSPDRLRATITIQNPVVSVCLDNGKVVQCP
jgi:hypothetical protein